MEGFIYLQVVGEGFLEETTKYCPCLSPAPPGDSQVTFVVSHMEAPSHLSVVTNILRHQNPQHTLDTGAKDKEVTDGVCSENEIRGAF